MPKIQKLFELNVTPEKFLDACSAEELMELEILLSKKTYQAKIGNHIVKLNS